MQFTIWNLFTAMVLVALAITYYIRRPAPETMEI
jgi:hypothetical protein